MGNGLFDLGIGLAHLRLGLIQVGLALVALVFGKDALLGELARAVLGAAGVIVRRFHTFEICLIGIDGRLLGDNAGVEILLVRDGVFEVADCLGNLRRLHFGIDLGQHLAGLHAASTAGRSRTWACGQTGFGN